MGIECDVMRYTNSLAIGYGALGRYEWAVRLYEEALSKPGFWLRPWGYGTWPRRSRRGLMGEFPE